MVNSSKFLARGPTNHNHSTTHHNSRELSQPNNTINIISEIDYLPCSQINLHHSENPTAQFYYNVELNDDLPYLAFVQEPYCVKGKPKHLPGNGTTFYHMSPDLTNPRASLTVSNNLANQFFFQKQFSNRDIATCSIELPTIKLYVSSIYMESNDSSEPPDLFIKLAEHCLLHRFGLIIGTDSNAHHTAWGNRNSNTRGFKLLNCLAQTGLLWEMVNKITMVNTRLNVTYKKLQLISHCATTSLLK